ncbi:hypothetical protein DFR68_1018 [Nocardia mexicana]|uniref:Transposase n=1 Tax=Nocardia mexicana TaxID=279262 RepID=A0A370HEF6_9NOCA|nr:hypothetical protein DFR68_1018 [Nocardia mexicana]
MHGNGIDCRGADSGLDRTWRKFGRPARRALRHRSEWKQAFLEAGTKALDEVPFAPAGEQGTPEQRRLRMQNEQLKLALAEATVQLRVWQHGAALVDQVHSVTSKP